MRFSEDPIPQRTRTSLGTRSPKQGLETLFPVLTSGEFRRRFWPDRHFVYHGSPNRLSGLADLPELKSLDSLTVAHRGPAKTLSTNPEGEHFEVPVEPARSVILYKFGTPLCFGDVNQSIPALDQWRAALAKELALPLKATNCSAYATPSGEGVPKHFDNREIIVVQIYGHKRWQIEANNDVNYPTENYGPGASWNWNSYRELGLYYNPDAVRPMPSTTITIEMKPGSALFLPRGMWHTTVARDDSLSLTFGLFTPMAAELLLSAIHSRVIRGADWREPVVAPNDEMRRDLIRQRLSQLVDRWREELAELTAEDLLAQLNTEALD